MDDPKAVSAKPKQTWLRPLRPLIWWLILVLVLFAYHTHERLSERTRLRFTVYLENNPVEYEASTAVDGRGFTIGQRIKIGSHILSVTHPKAYPFSTNLLIWYGEHDLGQVALLRMRGNLEVQVVPPAKVVSVSGGEFSAVLTNSGGITSSVPTAVYEIEARWAHHTETRNLDVTTNGTAIARFAPELACLTLESEPPGATVFGRDGHILGATPLVLAELAAGTWKGEVHLDGYIPVPISVVLVADQTNSFQTNLVNWQFAQAMETARTSFAAGDIDQTLQALAAALKTQPNDSAALELRQRAVIKQHLRNAEAFMVGGNYRNARAEAEAVLKIQPDNANASALLNEIATRAEAKQQKEKEEALALRQKRLAMAREAVDYAFRQHPDAPLFEAHEVQAGMSAHEAEQALYRELASAPAFRMVKQEVPAGDSFGIFAALEIPGGMRRCVIVGTQIETNETQIVFKVMEFKLKTVVGFQGSLTINRGYVTIDPTHAAELSEKERNQIKQGAILVEERIRKAVAQKNP